MLSSVVDRILGLSGLAAYAVVGGLAFAEAAFFVGFVLPGETAVVLGGVLAQQHRISLTGVAIVAVVAAIAGDSVGYEVGRLFGPRILASRFFASRQRAVERGTRALRDNGGRAVFLGRFTAFLRAVTPGLAGTVGLPYRTFLVWNAAGGVIWAVGFTMLGYLAGASYQKVEQLVGRASLGIVALIVVVLVVLAVRRHRAAREV